MDLKARGVLQVGVRRVEENRKRPGIDPKKAYARTDSFTSSVH